MRIKVCGMGSNLEAVAGLQPDYLGFIFWEPSVRYFEGKIEQHISPTKIGVFVDAEIHEVLHHVLQYGLDGVQLHGRETPEYCKILRLELVKLEKDIVIIKAFQVAADFQFEELNSYDSHVDYFLFDAKGELPGGNGIGFNWELLNAYSGTTPYFLSGGIGPQDFDQIRAFSKEPASALCHAIDVNSGFESKPGTKEIERLEPFMALIQELETYSK